MKKDLLKQTASNSLEAVVGLPSSTSLSNAMGTGRGIFGIWWSERRKLNWNTEHESAWAARRVQAQDIWAQ